MTDKPFKLELCERNAAGHWIAQTRDGKQVEIAFTDFGGDYPLGGRVTTTDKAATWFATWDRDGSVHTETQRNCNDLINVPKRFKIERWARIFNYHSNGVNYFTCHYHNSEKDAKSQAGNSIAIVKFTLEGIEGEGLEGGAK